MKNVLKIALGAGLLFAVGCELVVDFDRSKIPQPGSDASTQDVTQPPVSEAGTDSSVQDASTDAPIADAAKDVTTTDAGPDSATDASSDASSDAAPDAP